MRRLALAAVVAALVAGAASPAPAQSTSSTRSSRVVVRVPVDVRGAADPGAALESLRSQAGALRNERLNGCFSVEARPVASSSPVAHVVNVIAQRAGQYVRPSTEAAADPFSGPRELFVGERALAAERPLDGPLPLLLAADPPEAERGAISLIESVLDSADAAGDLKPCRWDGTLTIRSEFDRYRLVVTAELPFSFEVTPTEARDARVSPSTRSATAEDPDVGSCTGTGLEMFDVRLAVSIDESSRRFELRFTPQGAEPEFSLSCSRGRVELGGDYVRIAFLPAGTLRFEVDAAGTATATHRSTLEGRRVSATVSIARR